MLIINKEFYKKRELIIEDFNLIYYNYPIFKKLLTFEYNKKI